MRNPRPPAPWASAAPPRVCSAGLATLGALVACLATGCATAPRTPVDQAALLTPERLDRGYVMILPGIGGNASPEHELLIGLANSELPVAIEMYDWTAGPNQLLTNLHGLQRNRDQAQIIAGKIVAYQQHYPGRPVSVVGYSGGAGVAVMALEALPPQHRVTNAILLAATLAPDYDLRLAMDRTEQGIRNFYSKIDVPVLMGAMAVVGTMEGRHTVAAGAWGFTPPKQLDEQQREQYRSRLVQQNYNLDMLATGHTGGHFGWLEPEFIDQWLVPLVPSTPARDYQTVSFAPDPPAAVR